MHIALLEDDPAITDFLVSILTLEGHTIQGFTTGTSLLQRLLLESGQYAPFPFDVLLVDLHLPGGMSGRDVLARLDQTYPLVGLSIIVISAALASELARLQRAFPTIQIVRKPFKLHELYQALQPPRNTADEAECAV